MNGWRAIAIAAAIGLSWSAAPARAINIVIDDSYDTNGFFSVGSQARSALEAVTDFYSEILDDTFSAIVTPPPFTSSLPPHQNPGTAQWQWTMLFEHPSAAGQVTITNPSVAADEYRLFVGAKNLPGNTLGQAGPGGGSRQSTNNGGFFTSQEIAQLQTITSNFNSAVDKRAEPSGFARWGGVAMFDLDTPNWHFNHNTPPPAGANDFFSTAMHEIGHALGLGSSDEWEQLTAGSGNAAYFFGASAVAEYGGNVPLAYYSVGGSPVADTGHWRVGVMSEVFGSSAAQEAAMGPSINTGSRKRLTALDAAALTDIGWTVVPPKGLDGDFNHDNVVDAADYTVWRNGLGTAYFSNDYLLWKSHFGERSGSGASGSQPASVPEPASSLPFAVAMTLVFGRFFLPQSPRR